MLKDEKSKVISDNLIKKCLFIHIMMIAIENIYNQRIGHVLSTFFWVLSSSFFLQLKENRERGED